VGAQSRRRSLGISNNALIRTSSDTNSDLDVFVEHELADEFASFLM
jgi:hypothetical protein